MVVRVTRLRHALPPAPAPRAPLDSTVNLAHRIPTLARLPALSRLSPVPPGTVGSGLIARATPQTRPRPSPGARAYAPSLRASPSLATSQDGLSGTSRVETPIDRVQLPMRAG